MENVDNYKEQLSEYAKFLADNKLREQGKIVEGTKPVYVVYTRKSTKGKDRQERSIPDQISDCRRIIKELGIKPVKVFRERESAKVSGKRDKFSEMIDGIESGKYNSIIAWHPDRLARNMKEAGQIIDLLDRGKIVCLKFATYSFIRDANGIMTLGIQFVLAKQYSDNLSASSTRGSVKLALEGKSPTKKPKYGYVTNSMRYFRPDGVNFELIQKAFNMALDNRGLDKIADELNNNNFHYNGKKTKMTKQKLSNIFQDPFYAGIYLYGSSIIDLSKADPQFKPVISPLDFLELRRIMKDFYSFRKRKVKVQLFSKMVNCGYCGNLMSPGIPRSGGKSGYRYLTLRCNKKDCQSRYDKSIKRGVRGKVLVDFIINFLNSGLEVDKKTYNAYLSEAKDNLVDKRKELVISQRNVSRQITEYNNQIELKVGTLANARGNLIDKLNDQIDEIEGEIKELEDNKIKTQEAILAIDHNIKSDDVTYENFLNFFKSLGNMVKTSNNQLLVDKIIRMAFLNFDVKNKKVTSFRLNPFFEQYVNIPSVLSSRGAQN